MPHRNPPPWRTWAEPRLVRCRGCGKLLDREAARPWMDDTWLCATCDLAMHVDVDGLDDDWRLPDD